MTSNRPVLAGKIFIDRNDSLFCRASAQIFKLIFKFIFLSNPKPNVLPEPAVYPLFETLQLQCIILLSVIGILLIIVVGYFLCV